jgi:hypothetical protein
MPCIWLSCKCLRNTGVLQCLVARINLCVYRCILDSRMEPTCHTGWRTEQSRTSPMHPDASNIPSLCCITPSAKKKDRPTPSKMSSCTLLFTSRPHPSLSSVSLILCAFGRTDYCCWCLVVLCLHRVLLPRRATTPPISIGISLHLVSSFSGS